MINKHHLNKTTHSDFLQQERIDPITGEKIEKGHTVVICGACKSAFFIESWEYLGGIHCNQKETLPQIPVSKSLQLVAKPLEYLPFLFRKEFSLLDEKLKDVNISLIVFVLFFAFISTCLIGVWVGSITQPLLGLLFIVGVFSSLGLYMKNSYEKEVFRIKPTPKESYYLAINSKQQSITIRKKDKVEQINFTDITKVNYSLGYQNYQISGKHHQHTLYIEIKTKLKEDKEIYTVIHKDEIPHWSKFLEELPNNIPVLNQK